MSCPNHLTSGIKDAFSSNFPDFILASPDYVPASPGKTYSSSSNLFDVVPMALPTLSLFHDDPYVKVIMLPKGVQTSDATAKTQATIKETSFDSGHSAARSTSSTMAEGNNLKPYVRRFQELAVLCPNMLPNTEKLLQAFIGGLPRSIEGNVTALKPQTL
ncbi:hypothetical protein Tco_1016362 [Tanacetum coccineum]|uniref:Reverse transcriptase domain-containing protein n=1 Tax=Tanacetum coccineum TaxID=301880 RepID=A0ABQ5FQV0_9ASTR